MYFKVTDLEIPGVRLIQTQVYADERGHFCETFNRNQFEKLGLPISFLQDNQSLSQKGVLRGLHLQARNPQGKLIRVFRGRIFDVIVDLRKSSSSYKRYLCLELSDPTQMLWIPKGLAHGFCVMGDEPAEVSYKVDAPYDPKDETGIIWNDPDLNIPWPIQCPIISQKDDSLPRLNELIGRL